MGSLGARTLRQALLARTHRRLRCVPADAHESDRVAPGDRVRNLRRDRAAPQPRAGGADPTATLHDEGRAQPRLYAAFELELQERGRPPGDRLQGCAAHRPGAERAAGPDYAREPSLLAPLPR